MSEAERLAALHRYDILDTDPEPQFDHIVELAARMFEAPVASIGLLDADRLWYKARYGTDTASVPRELAASTSAIENGRVEVIPDTLLNERFRQHPHVVGGARYRFMAIAPILSSDRQPIGAVSVRCFRPRPDLPADRIAGLQALARLVESELERRVLERERQEAVENFRDLAEVSAEWVWQTDTEHRLVGLSTNLPHMKRIGVTRVGTRRWEQVNARALSCTWAEHIADLKARREFRGFEYEGNGFASRVSGRPRFDARGKFLGYRGTGIDITARQRATERLSESELTFRELFEKHPNPMCVYTRSDLRILAANAAACVLYGYDRATFQTLTIPDVCPPETREQIVATIAGYRGDGPTRAVVRHQARDGTAIDVVSDGVAIDFNGSPARLVHITDITQQRRAEARLVQAEATLRQAEKLEAIGRLTGGIAHDFNNILAIMMVKLEGIADELPPDSPFHQKIAAAMDAGERGAAIVSRLMTFARRRRVEPEEILVGELLDDVAGLLRTAISRKVTLSMDHASDLRRCRIDRGGFETAILNLAVNARDAMPNGGTLDIATRNRAIGDDEARSNPGLQAGDWVETTISDSGTGMPPEVLVHIFEPFFTTKAEGKGTGLGLAMVHGFVHQSGGFLTVDSAPGEGTTFALYLPAVRQASGAASSAESDRTLVAAE